MKRLFSTLLLLTLAAVPSNTFGMEPRESGKKSKRVGTLRALFEKTSQPNEPERIAIRTRTSPRTAPGAHAKNLPLRGSPANNYPKVVQSPTEPNENLTPNISNDGNKPEPLPAPPTPEPQPEIVDNVPQQPRDVVSDAKSVSEDSDRINPASPIEDLHASIQQRRPQEDEDNFSDNDDSFDDITSFDAKALHQEETKGKAKALSQHRDSTEALIKRADTIAKRPTSSPKLPTEAHRLRNSGIAHSNSSIDLTDVAHEEWEDGEPDPAAQTPIEQAPLAQIPFVEQAPIIEQEAPFAQVNAPARGPAPATTKKSPKEETAPEYDAWPGKNILITAGLYLLMHSLQNTEHATKIKEQYPKSSEAAFTLGKQTLAANAIQQLLPGKSANSLAFSATFTALHVGEMLLKKAASTLAKKAPFKKLALAFKKLSATKQANLEKLGNFAGWGIKTLIARNLSS